MYGQNRNKRVTSSFRGKRSHPSSGSNSDRSRISDYRNRGNSSSMFSFSSFSMALGKGIYQHTFLILTLILLLPTVFLVLRISNNLFGSGIDLSLFDSSQLSTEENPSSKKPIIEYVNYENDDPSANQNSELVKKSDSSVPLGPLMGGKQGQTLVSEKKNIGVESSGSDTSKGSSYAIDDSLLRSQRSKISQRASSKDSSQKHSSVDQAHQPQQQQSEDKLPRNKRYGVDLPINSQNDVSASMHPGYKVNPPSEVECDWSMERSFNSSIEILRRLKLRNMIPTLQCPEFFKDTGWRPGTGYLPFVFGDYCEPWWARDAVYIVSKLLQPWMKAVEYGSGISSIWIALHTRYLVAVESNGGWTEGVRNISRDLGLDNIEVRRFNLGRKYVELDFNDKPGGLDWTVSGGGGIDFVSVDGRLRKPCLDYIVPLLRNHGGILLFDNSDRPDSGNDSVNWDGEKALNSIPSNWLRYDSLVLDSHRSALNTDRWLQNGQTSLFISRDPRCGNPPV